MYKVSGVMLRNLLVDKHLVLRERLDDVLQHLLPWDIELLIKNPWIRPKRNMKFKWINFTHTYSVC
jgi:hypothetical protein